MSPHVFDIQQSAEGYYVTMNGIPIHEIIMDDAGDSECFECASMFRDFAQTVADAIRDA